MARGTGEFYTLSELSKFQQTRMAKATIKTIVQNADLFEILKFDMCEELTYDVEVDRSLGEVGVRDINENWEAHRPTYKTKTERAAIFGGEVIHDVALLKGKGAKKKDQLKRKHYRMFSRALAFRITEDLIEGDTGVNDKTIPGWRVRARGTQSKLAGTNTGADLDLGKLNSAVGLVIGGGDCWLFNRSNQIQMLNLFQNIGSAGGGTPQAVWKQNEMGKQVMEYNGKKILVIERSDDGSTFLDFDEDPGDGNADTSSIYLLKIGEGYTHGFINGSKKDAMTIKDFGELQEGPRVMGRMEANIGLVVVQKRAFARLRGLNKAA